MTFPGTGPEVTADEMCEKLELIDVKTDHLDRDTTSKILIRGKVKATKPRPSTRTTISAGIQSHMVFKLLQDQGRDPVPVV